MIDKPLTWHILRFSVRSNQDRDVAMLPRHILSSKYHFLLHKTEIATIRIPNLTICQTNVWRDGGFTLIFEVLFSYFESILPNLPPILKMSCKTHENNDLFWVE